MEIRKDILAEQKLNKIAAYVPYVHCAGFAALIALVYLKPCDYSIMAEGLAVIFLFSTFIMNRIYIHAGKELEKLKDFSEQETKERTKEYFMKFFAPIFFWTAVYVILK